MRYIEALETYDPKPGERSVFLAGSINGAPDWQAKFRTRFEDTDLVLLNPRRNLVNDRGAWDGPEGNRQIDWEHEHLRKVSAVSFWFAAEGQGYSSALELGAMLERTPDLPTNTDDGARWSFRVFVGTHPLYWKASTVAYQARKRCPELVVVENLFSLADQIRVYFGYERFKEGR